MEQKVYVIGIGPGAYEEMTIRAVKALKECDVIIGYTVYVDLVKEHFPGKRFLTTPMTWEVKRCEMALREAEAGQVTAMICSGDAGVYGMAGLMYEMREHMELGGVKITVIPGKTTTTAGAARLGAPLLHDFAVISLSALLTPWEQIEDYLRRACDIMLEYRSPDTVCGYVRQIAREGEEQHLMTLAQLKDTTTDMFTTVFIGTSRTRRIGEAMVTPRGYHYGTND